MDQQHTIGKQVSISGVGLHTGNKSTLTFQPAPTNTGIVFRRVDLASKPEVKADIDNVVDISRGTTIQKGEARVHTTEHVLAAVAGMMIDNMIIELDANEPPVIDGSALPFVQTLKEAGFVAQDSPRDYLVIEKPIAYSDEKRGIDIVVFPSDEFRITFLVDYKNPALGTQYTAMYSVQDEFEREFAPARTFCFLSEVETLLQQGLIKGGSLDNAIVIVDRHIDKSEFGRLKELFGFKRDITLGSNGILNNMELRFKNEPVRHKALDLLGDLALLGVPLKAHIQAARSGHAANVELVRRIRKEYERIQITSKYQGVRSNDYVLTRRQLKKSCRTVIRSCSSIASSSWCRASG